MSKLFNDLAILDKKIADRWKIRTRDNDKHVLSAADVDFILADVIKSARTTDITEKQGSAIVMLSNASIAANAAKSAPALDRITFYVNIWEKAFRLNLKPLVTELELRPIADFLRNGAVSKVIFKSPGTNISYAPFDYMAVGKLILNRDVTVLQSMTGGLSVYADDAGLYLHKENLFILYNVEPRAARLTLVHEATHIVQDWQDVSSFAHYDEADAFIAQAVAELTLFPNALEADDVSKKARVAAKMVIDQTAVDSNKDWQTAYKNVVTVVGQRYKEYGLRIDHAEKGEGANERTKYQALLKKIAIADNIAKGGA